MNIDFSKIKADRLDLWHAAVNSELQQAITTAAGLRQKISESKTQVKKDYYHKKFQKVSDTVMQLIAVQSQLPPAPSDTPTTSEPTVTDTSEPTTTTV